MVRKNVASLGGGQPLTINYNTLISQMQTITGNFNMSVNVSRSLTRLKSLYISCIKSFTVSSATDLDGLNTEVVGNKEWNVFVSPMF